MEQTEDDAAQAMRLGSWRVARLGGEARVGMAGSTRRSTCSQPVGVGEGRDRVFEVGWLAMRCDALRCLLRLLAQALVAVAETRGEKKGRRDASLNESSWLD